MIPAFTATPKTVSVCVIPASLVVDAKVSAPDLGNASTTNVNVAKKKEMLIWVNTVSCRDAQASVPVLIMAFVTWTVRNVFVLKVGQETIVVRQIVQGRPSVLAMEAAATRIQDGATASQIGLVRSVSYLV